VFIASGRKSKKLNNVNVEVEELKVMPSVWGGQANAFLSLSLSLSLSLYGRGRGLIGDR